MIIENSDALKSWLTSCLEHMCDADPAALAKYVMALVKKDKNEDQLKDICLDQLDVFLQKETKPFVDMLFETLSTKSYLQGKPPMLPIAPPVVATASAPPAPVAAAPSLLPTHKESVSTPVASLSMAGLAPAPLPCVAATATVEASLPPLTAAQQGKSLVATTAAGLRKEEAPPVEEEKEPARTSHRKSKSRSRSPVGGRSRNRSREDERRSGRRFSNERRRRANDRRRHEPGGRHRGGDRKSVV